MVLLDNLSKTKLLYLDYQKETPRGTELLLNDSIYNYNFISVVAEDISQDNYICSNPVKLIQYLKGTEISFSTRKIELGYTFIQTGNKLRITYNNLSNSKIVAVYGYN